MGNTNNILVKLQEDTLIEGKVYYKDWFIAVIDGRTYGCLPNTYLPNITDEDLNLKYKDSIITIPVGESLALGSLE